MPQTSVNNARLGFFGALANNPLANGKMNKARYIEAERAQRENNMKC